MFCGGVDITNADFVQAVFNVLTPIAYSQYSLIWSEVNERITKQPQAIRSDFTLDDYKEIVEGTRTCPTGTCTLQKPEQLSVYTKYCTWNPESCGIQDTLKKYNWLKK